MHWEAVGILGLDFMCVRTKVLALSRVLKLSASFSGLQMPWQWLETLGLQMALVFCFSTQAGCQVAGCRCWLYLAFSGSCFFILNGRVIHAQMVSPKDLCCSQLGDPLLCWYSVVSSESYERGWKHFADFLHSE